MPNNDPDWYVINTDCVICQQEGSCESNTRIIEEVKMLSLEFGNVSAIATESGKMKKETHKVHSELNCSRCYLN
jgi:hypothetical protein